MKESRGRFGYSKCWSSLTVAGFELLHGGNGGGFHLRLSGNACAAFRGHLRDLLDLGRPSRIDLAADLDVPMCQVEHHIRNGLYRNCGQTYKRIESNRGESEVTWYLGSRQSGKMLRVYSKEHATRFEWELKGEVAANIGMLIARGAAIADVIRSLGSFLAKKGANSARDIVVSWWASIGQKCQLPKLATVEHSLNRSIRWLEKQVLGTIAMVADQAPELLELMIEDSKQCFKQKVRSLLTGGSTISVITTNRGPSFG